MTSTPLTQKILTLGNTHHLPTHWLAERPHLFSQAVVHLSAHQADSIKNTIRTIEHIATLPTFQSTVLSYAAPQAQKNPGNVGVLFGYDFHLTPEGPKLIEINSNAGGAFLIALLEEAHGIPHALEKWRARLIEMFLAEWHKKHPDQPLRSIAIVDDDPLNQYFYPEFLLFQNLFQAHHIDCRIVNSTDFYMKEKKLWVEDKAIDLVYNRLTDFDLSQPMHAILQQAYAENLVVLTPHPHAYTLYANKRNLTLLSDTHFLMTCGLEEKIIQQLQLVIPATFMVDTKNTENVWNTRKQFFFKPASSYGGKGVYRGYNITKRVLSEILAGDYIAQMLIPPSEMQVDGERRKMDLRAYVYQGEILGFGARLYQGQTTNFRTQGGGFTVVRAL